MAEMSFTVTDEQKALKAAVYDLCKQYPAEYWREIDAKREYPEAFVAELTKAGYLAVLIPRSTAAGSASWRSLSSSREIGRAATRRPATPVPSLLGRSTSEDGPLCLLCAKPDH